MSARRTVLLGFVKTLAIMSAKGDFMQKRRIIFSAAALAVSLAAHSQATSSGGLRYRWHDGQGRLHLSDTLTADAMKYGFDAVNDQGLVINRVPRQMTPEERDASNKLAAEQAAKQRIEQERINAEAQMLEAYPDESSYKIFQQQTLDTIDQQIKTVQLNLRGQEKSLTDLLARAADMERTQKSVPKFMVDSIASQRAVVTDQRATLQRLQDKRVQTVKDQVTQLARYRQLKSAQGKPTS
jgi:hypothetical protein